MIGEPRDRTGEVKAVSGKLEVGLYNYCDFFEQDAERLFSSRECWYCKYGDFGIFTEHPTQNGVCRYKESINSSLDSSVKRCASGLNVQADERQEEEKG